MSFTKAALDLLVMLLVVGAIYNMQIQTGLERFFSFCFVVFLFWLVMYSSDSTQENLEKRLDAQKNIYKKLLTRFVKLEHMARINDIEQARLDNRMRTRLYRLRKELGLSAKRGRPYQE